MLFRSICIVASLIAMSFVSQWSRGQDEIRPAKPSAATIEAFLKLCETTRRGAIVQFEHELRGLQAKGTSDNKSLRRIRTLELHLEALRAGKHPVVPTLSFPPEVGAIGRLPRLTCYVDRVLSGQEMLVRVYFPVKVATVEHFRGKGETHMPAVNFLVRGISTADYHAASNRELSAVLQVTARRPATTAGATPTWVLEPFDMTAIEAHFRHETEHTP